VNSHTEYRSVFEDKIILNIRMKESAEDIASLWLFPRLKKNMQNLYWAFVSRYVVWDMCLISPLERGTNRNLKIINTSETRESSDI
jgi:hypothetical protein